MAAVVTRTFLTWDLAGSTRFWERDPAQARAVVDAWTQCAERAVGSHGGRVFKLTGDGGWAAFESASAALDAATDLQVAMAGGEPGARTALYSGEAEPVDGDWLGVPLNRCARLVSLGHPGQILVAGSTALLLGTQAGLVELGLHRLRDVPEPVVVLQVIDERLPHTFPPLRSDVRGVNLPVPRDRLVARDADVEHVGRLLTDSRLVTLAGVGGTGKTRLAIEAARVASDRFELTTFVDLAPLTSPALVVPTALEAVGTPPVGDVGVADLASVLVERPTLLVLDNAEHVLDAVADLCDELLDRCPHLTTLVTSREPLGVDGERVWRVPSLDPATGGVELFLERIGLAVHRDVAVAVCTHLDGIPLAIELAAARARSLGADEVLAKMSDRFRVLIGGRRASGRQATMQAALDWSHQLLDEAEQAVLRRLSVFAGGFTVQAAEQVCGPVNDRTVADIVASLVDKSLVVYDPTGRRHRMLETVRAFAHERLVDAREAAAYHEAHYAWLRTAVDTLPFNDSTTQLPLVPEASNLRAAVDWLAANGRDADLITFVVDTAGVWRQILGERELQTRVRAAVARIAQELTPCEQVDVALLDAWLGGDFQESVATARRLDPERRCEDAVFTDALVALIVSFSDGAAALGLLAEITARWPEPRPPDWDLMLRVIENHARWLSGDRRGAEDVLVRLLDGHPSIYRFGPVLALASMRIALGDLTGAEDVLAHVDEDPHHRDRIGLIAIETVRSELHTARGELAEAAALLRQAEAIRDRHLSLYPAADHHWFEAAGYLAVALGDLGDAAVLVAAAAGTLGTETSPFLTWHLLETYGSRPDWQAAVQVPPTLEYARAVARSVARRR